MRKAFYLVALVIVALLALCSLVFGFLVWQNQNALMKSLDDLKLELGMPSTPPATPGNGGGNNGGTQNPPPAASTCLAQDQIISVNTPDAECCPGLIEVDASASDLLKGITARCVGI